MKTNILARMKNVPLSLWKQRMKHVKTLGGTPQLLKDVQDA